MDLSGVFSDDQLAVIGCFIALTVCGLIAAVSFQFGPAGRDQNKVDAVRSRTLPLEKPQQAQREDRRAA
ncbi:MAG: hypothetical protein R3C17_17290 [Planctomycetaceae bacterium]